MASGKSIGTGRGLRVRRPPRASGLPLAAKITLTCAAIFAVFMAIFGAVVYRHARESTEKEIDRYGAGLVNVLATFELSAWEDSQGTISEITEWLEVNSEFAPLLEEVFELRYVPRAARGSSPGTGKVPDSLKEKFRRDQKKVQEENQKRTVKMLGFTMPSKPETRFESGDVLNVFIQREGKEPGTVARAREANFEASRAAIPYRVDVNGEALPTEVRIQIGRDRDSGERARLYSHPIRDGKSVVGRAYVVLSEAKIEERLGRLRLITVLLTGLFILTGAGASFLIIRKMTHPLRFLVEDIEIVASGDLTHRTQALSNDEIGLVARTFDEMTRGMLEAQEAERKHREIEHDLSLVQDLHEKLLPLALPTIEGYEIGFFSRPGAAIGADYYDVLELEGGQTAILMAGLPRKGLPAAVLMAVVRTLLRVELRGGDGPAEILKRVNWSLAQDIRKGMYATVLLLVLDNATRRAQVASAGHSPLLVHREVSGKVEAIAPDGIALGLDPGPMFERSIKETGLDLAPGDRIVLHSTGLTRVTSKAGEELGMPRLLALIRKASTQDSTRFAGTLGAQVARFREGGDDSEDLTLLTLRVLP
jgi:serine phosphatase RsbU (regulator of sigma subunit)